MRKGTILFEYAYSIREHQFIVSMDDDFVYGTLLACLPLHKRLWSALKYVVGYVAATAILKN